MAQNYGNLELRQKKLEGGAVVEAYMGLLAVPDIVAGSIASAKKKKVVGNEWPLEVKIRQSGGEYATLGSAKFERKNSSASFYLRIVLESPLIERKIGGPLWLRAFPQTEDKGDRPAAVDYDIVWGSGGGQAKPNDTPAELDDEIPFI